jgi:hypothetical protein
MVKTSCTDSAGGIEFRAAVSSATQDLEHEAVLLGFGQRVGALLLDGVLRRQHEERRVERMTLPPTVTCRSCIASSSAAWVLGGVRLISSARITLAKTGPRRNLNERCTGGLVLLDHLGAGDVRGHQVGRELDAREGQRQRTRERRDHQRLGQTRHAFEYAVAAANSAMSSCSTTSILTDDHLAQLGPDTLGSRNRCAAAKSSAAAGRFVISSLMSYPSI